MPQTVVAMILLDVMSYCITTNAGILLWCAFSHYSCVPHDGSLPTRLTLGGVSLHLVAAVEKGSKVRCSVTSVWVMGLIFYW
eukprot:scaffold16935_cov85-Attheya_sp.AAC.2